MLRTLKMDIGVVDGYRVWLNVVWVQCGELDVHGFRRLWGNGVIELYCCGGYVAQ